MDKPKPMKRINRVNCKLSENDTLNLENTLLSFNGPIGQEQAWAVCHQTAKSLSQLGSNQLQELTSLNQILLHREGHVLLDLHQGKFFMKYHKINFMLLIVKFLFSRFRSKLFI